LSDTGISDELLILVLLAAFDGHCVKLILVNF